MDLQELMPWLGAIALILSLGNTVTSFLTSGAKKTAGDLAAFKESQALRLQKVDEQIDGHDSRIQELESTMRHLPDRQVVHELQLTMKDIQIELAGVKASTETAARTSRRVEEFLLDKAKAAA
jgi:hypothetical protein